MAKFIYFGSSTFSKIVLENIIRAGYRPSLIITKPDTPKGRGLKMHPTEVSKFAQKNKIKAIKPQKLNEKELQDKLSGAETDYIVVADYGKIIPFFLLSLPKKLPLGIHPSLLPSYRGAAPIERSLMAGEKITGATIFKLNQSIDSGEIVLQNTLAVAPNDNYFTLQTKLAVLGAKSFIQSLKKIQVKQYKLVPQDENKATLAPKLTKKEGRINWNSPAEKIKNLIRATLNWPTAYTYYQDKIVKITEATAFFEKSEKVPSTIIKVDKSGIYVATSTGILKITKLKPAGKKEMSSWAFACGYKIKEDDFFK